MALEIVAAIYYILDDPDKYVDISPSHFQALITNNILIINGNLNEIAGEDPFPGMVKAIKLEYKFGSKGKIKTKIFKEGEKNLIQGRLLSQAIIEEPEKHIEVPEMTNYWFNSIEKATAESFTYDYCFVCTVLREDAPCEILEASFEKFVTTLKFAGLKTHTYFSVNKKSIFVIVGAKEKRLMVKAATSNHYLLLEAEHVKMEAAKQGMRMHKFHVAHKTDPDNYEFEQLTDDIWQNIYAPYELPSSIENINTQYIFTRYNDDGPGRQNSLFTPTDRLKLTYSIFEEEKSLEPNFGGCGFKMSKLISDEDCCVEKYFPIHKRVVRSEISAEWKQYTSLLFMPLTKLRNYFGERYAFYYAFLQYYSYALLLPALMGIFWFAFQLSDKTVDIRGLIFMAIFMSLWATIMLEFWKRKESELRAVWGQEFFNETEEVRPDFVEDYYIRNPIDASRDKYFSSTKFLLRSLLSRGVILTLMGCVIACVIGIFLLRIYLVRWNATYGSIITSIVNAVQIQILNFLYAYNSLFYIAFFKQYDESVGGCTNGDCLGELQTQLGTIFIVQMVVDNSIGVITPIINFLLAKKDVGPENVGRVASQCEQESLLQVPLNSPFVEFDALAIQYGYVTLFVVAFPLAPVLALINNFIINYAAATNACTLRARPIPFGAENIGTWYDVFDYLGIIAVLTNICLIIFQTQQINTLGGIQYSPYGLLWIAIILEHAILGCKFLIAFYVPDETKYTLNLIGRSKYLADVLLKGLDEEPDEDDLENMENIEEPEEALEVLDLNNIHEYMESNIYTSNCST